MADQRPSVPIPTSAMPVAAPQSAKQYHWWYDSRVAGVRNSPPSNMASSPPITYGGLSQSPATAAGIAATGIPVVTRVRKDSLRNMVHLCDFATP